MSEKYINYMIKEAKEKSVQIGNKVNTQMCIMTLLSFFAEKRGMDAEARPTTYQMKHEREIKRVL